MDLSYSELDQNGHQVYGGAISVSPAKFHFIADNFHIRNNIFYNCGNPYAVIGGTGLPRDSGINVDYNLINAGAAGSTSIGISPAQAHGVSSAPAFERYTPYASNNIFRAASATSNIVNAGINISHVTADIEARARPQGGSWDIGAYEYRMHGS